MKLVQLTAPLSVYQVENLNSINLNAKPVFIGVTEDENSVVGPTKNVPDVTISREDGWSGFKIEGVLDFSLVGILAKIASLLADKDISIFAVSTYNTDYVLLKNDKMDAATKILKTSGYVIE